MRLCCCSCCHRCRRACFLRCCPTGCMSLPAAAARLHGRAAAQHALGSSRWQAGAHAEGLLDGFRRHKGLHPPRSRHVQQHREWCLYKQWRYRVERGRAWVSQCLAVQQPLLCRSSAHQQITAHRSAPALSTHLQQPALGQPHLFLQEAAQLSQLLRKGKAGKTGDSARGKTGRAGWLAGAGRK